MHDPAEKPRSPLQKKLRRIEKRMREAIEKEFPVGSTVTYANGQTGVVDRLFVRSVIHHSTVQIANGRKTRGVSLYRISEVHNAGDSSPAVRVG